MKITKNKRKESIPRKIFHIFNTLFFSFLVLSVILPFAKILGQSFSWRELYGLEFFPHSSIEDIYMHILAYRYVFSYNYTKTPIAVSFVTTFLITLFGLLISSVSAFILTQKNMPGRKLFAALLIIALTFDAGIIQKFLVIKKIGLFDTLWAVILPSSLNVFNIFLMKKYFETIPQNILDAAVIDGCSPVDMFIKITLPLSKAALAAIGLSFAVAAWNEYLAYVMYINDYSKYNMQYILRDMFADKTDSPCSSINLRFRQSAQIVVTALPMIILSLFAQKFYTPEFTMASVKE